jgi:asparagine synthetase B (glutamine-hydrolysing)
MCGFAGFVNIDGAPADAAVLSAMTDLVRHRGPDDRGTLCLSLRGGYRFRTVTDSEVLLALYERVGLDRMLDRLDGMFAIVIPEGTTGSSAPCCRK